MRRFPSRPLLRLAVLLGVCSAVLFSVSPASAIIDGQPDSTHPYVGVVVADYPGYGTVAYCSGTLVSPTAFVTAAHCVAGLPAGVRLLGLSVDPDPFSDSDLDSHLLGIKDFVYFPGFALPDVYTDIAVIHLTNPVWMSTYGTLPTVVGALESLKDKKADDTTFTVVGYGWQQFVPHSDGLGVRRWTTSRMQGFRYATSPPGKGDASASSLLELTKNQGSAGTVCYSDSGGPLFAGPGNAVAAITVAGSKNCTGSYEGLRLDTVPVLSFLNKYAK